MSLAPVPLRKNKPDFHPSSCPNQPCEPKRFDPTGYNFGTCEDRGCGSCNQESKHQEGRCTAAPGYNLSFFKKGLPLPWVSIEAFLKEGFRQSSSNFVSLSMNGGEKDTKPFFHLLVKRGLKHSKLIFGYGKRNRRIVQAKSFGDLVDGMHVTRVLRHGWKRLLVRLRSEKVCLEIVYSKQHGRRMRKVRTKVSVF